MQTCVQDDIVKTHTCLPAKKRALEGQEREQTSAPELLVQLSWARGAGFPLGRHFTTSEEHKPFMHHGNGPENTHTHKHTQLVLTNTVLFVPVQFLSRRTHTLIAPLSVYTSVLAAPIIDAALVNI